MIKFRHSDLISSAVLGLHKVFAFGNSKYPDTKGSVVIKPTDKKTKVEDYMAACARHLAKYNSGVILDSESGLPHLDHAIANITIIKALEKENEK